MGIKEKVQLRNMATISTLKKVTTVCIECAKGVITLGGGLEIGYE